MTKASTSICQASPFVKLCTTTTLLPQSHAPQERPLCTRPCSVGARIIKQCFGTCDIPRRGTSIIGQNIKTGFTVTERRADRRQRLMSQGTLVRRKTAGQQFEGIHLGQAFGLDFHCHESVPGKFRTQGGPIATDFGLVAAKKIRNRRGDAGNMNMQLVLAAACRRIYRHPDLVTRQLAARPLFNEAAGFPSCLPIIWGILALQRRAFNTGNAICGNDKDMRSARRRLEHGNASIETVGNVYFEAGKRDADAAVGRQADVMNNEPQPTSVGCRYRMQLTYGHGGGQARGCGKSRKFMQEEPGPKCRWLPDQSISSLGFHQKLRIECVQITE